VELRISRLWVQILPGAPFMDEQTIDVVQMLIARLERIAVDSYWAHRASGVRGELLKMVENVETGNQIDVLKVKPTIALGFVILEHAAREQAR
jgi:hypothetical protein